jgi:GMP synthase (glutamine-hydrolysing)
MPDPFHFLITESEPPEARQERRESVGRSSGETYIKALSALAPGATFHRIKPADAQAEIPDRASLQGYDAIFVSGSPLHVYEDIPETRREVEFMRRVFASGTPSFGSCAGLQIAVVAAGGAVAPSRKGRVAGFARHIVREEAGQDHPLLRDRPSSFDAPSFHSDEVVTLPEGAQHIASNMMTSVQALEITYDGGVFWGVQYHPELDLYEVAGALRRQKKSLLKEGLVRSNEALEDYASTIESLHHDPARHDLSWQLGIDEQLTDARKRIAELRNFIAYLPEFRTR